MVLLWSIEDRAAVQPRVVAMAEIYKLPTTLRCRDQAPLTDDERELLREELRAADEIWVFWSKGARRSPFVIAALQLAVALEAEEAAARRPSMQAPTRMVTMPLDSTVLVPGLPPPQPDPRIRGEHPIRAAVWSGLNTLGGLSTLALGTWGYLLGDQGALWWVAVVALLACAILLGLAQIASQGDWVVRTGQVYRWGSWLAHATVPQILSVSERILVRIYGEKPLSWRSITASALLGTATVLPLALLWAWSLAFMTNCGLDSTATVVGIKAASDIIIPLSVLNLIFDFIALLMTRGVLCWLLRNPTIPRIALGLVADMLLLLTTALLPLVLNVQAKANLGDLGQVLTNPAAVVEHLALLFMGGLHLANLGRDFVVSGLLISGMSMLTGCLPTLVHGSMLLVAGANQAMGRLPGRVLGEALRRLADRPAGPQEALVPAGVLALAFLSALSPWRGEISEEDWMPITSDTCQSGCAIGVTDSGSERIVTLQTGFKMQTSELTQATWSRVISRAHEMHQPTWGLPDQPSVYRGKNLPVESVTQCEAERFANLWSLVEGYIPAYSAAGSNPAALEGCESGAEIHWNVDANGYRLPTETEYLVAAWACQPPGVCTSAGYLAAHAAPNLWQEGSISSVCKWRPGPVMHHRPNLLGLYDIPGNIAELVWSAPPPGMRSGPNGGAEELSNQCPFPEGLLDDISPTFQATIRDWYGPKGNWFALGGFRLVQSIAATPTATTAQ